MKQLFIVLVLIALTSCATHRGNVISTTNATNQNHTYVDLAVGYSEATYIFGIGGLSKDMLFAEAYRNMRMAYPLEPNQTLENLVVNSKRTWVGPFLKHEVITLADVVEWEDDLQITYAKKYEHQFLENKTLSTEDISLNDKMMFLNNREVLTGRVVSLSDNKAIVFYFDALGHFQLKKLNHSKLFWGEDASKQYNNFKVGDTVIFKKYVSKI